MERMNENQSSEEEGYVHTTAQPGSVIKTRKR